jgi:hypothetical protein
MNWDIAEIGDTFTSGSTGTDFILEAGTLPGWLTAKSLDRTFHNAPNCWKKGIAPYEGWQLVSKWNSAANAKPIFAGPTLADMMGQPPKKTRKLVSTNGKDWVDYAKMYDPDCYENYPHRKEE